MKKWWVNYPERYNPKGKIPDGLWHFDIPTQGSWGNGYVRHFCPLPEEMIAQILKIATKEGDLVLDPFAGSGAVLAKAANMNRNFIGFELNDSYIKMFKKYLKELCQDLSAMVPAGRGAGQLVVEDGAEIDLSTAIGIPLGFIVSELLTNAIKFSSPGGTIEVFATRMASGELVIGVRVEGIGIKSEDQAQVVERYGRAQHQTSHALESTGLGLAIVKGLAEAHGGRVVLQSEPGRGTCVTIWLPASRVGPQPSQALAS